MTTATTPEPNAIPKEGRPINGLNLLKVEAHNDNLAPADFFAGPAPACAPDAEDRFDFTGLAEDASVPGDGAA